MTEKAKRYDVCKCVICCGSISNRGNCRLFDWEEVDFVPKEELKSIFGERFTDNKVLYICRPCERELKNVGKKSNGKVQSEQNFVCTCCHMESKVRFNFVLFARKKYDFKNAVVIQAFSKEFRKKTQMEEFICKKCHKDLSNKHGERSQPIIPRDAACLRMPVSFAAVKRDAMDKHKWSAYLKQLQNCQNFTELENMVNKTSLPGNVSVAFNFQISRDIKDNLATDLYPEDGPLPKKHCLPIWTKGDGSCFFNSISRLCFGNDSHSIELRVRTIFEAVKNKTSYLNHEYLCRGFSNPYHSGIHLADIYRQYGADSLQSLCRDKHYEQEVMDLRKDNTYCGIWQVHQMANVIHSGIHLVFPMQGLNTVRKDMNRMIFPSDVQGQHGQYLPYIIIMWTKSSANSSINHFVPVVR